MALPSVFNISDVSTILNRIHSLTPHSEAKWGKMNVSQMLAHLCVSYDLAYGKTVPKYNPFMKLIMRTVIKKMVTNEKTYKPNGPTAPVFVVSDQREFERERSRLIDNINETLTHGSSYFEGRENVSFGKLTAEEWNNMFYKHLDHHLRQFGV
jgi:hypothetical protein